MDTRSTFTSFRRFVMSHERPASAHVYDTSPSQRVAIDSVVVRFGKPWWIPPWVALCSTLAVIISAFVIFRFIIPQGGTEETSPIENMHRDALATLERIVTQPPTTQTIVVEYPSKTPTDPFEDVKVQAPQVSQEEVIPPMPPVPPAPPPAIDRVTVAQVLSPPNGEGQVQTVILGTIPQNLITYDDTAGKVTAFNLSPTSNNESWVRSWFTFTEAAGHDLIMITVPGGKKYFSLRKHMLKYQNGTEEYLLIPFDSEDSDPGIFIEVYPPFNLSIVQEID